MKLAHLFLLVLIASCASPPTHSERRPSGGESITVASFPEINQDDGKLGAAIQKALKKNLKHFSPQDIATISDRLKHYLLFLGLTSKDFEKAAKVTAPLEAENRITVPTVRDDPDGSGDDDDGDKTPSNLKAISRLFSSSTQFLFCPDLTNWECLEKTPQLLPAQAFRQESRADLGTAISAGDTLNTEVFFTEAWDGSPRAGLVDRLAERLHADVGKSLSLAMYGIDDINGTMKPVYDALTGFHDDPAINFRSVIDVSGFEKPKMPWVLDYITPQSDDPDAGNRWVFGKSLLVPTAMHATFQYDGTPDFIRKMNFGIATENAAKVRIEWPTSHIMHNKFAVLENMAGVKSVWTGTANFSNHCMGAEANSNMSIYLKNDSIAQAYLDEFNLMYEFDPALALKSKLVIGPSDAAVPMEIGRFHHNKFPVSHRLFTFTDGTRARIHFAPTDDAEHRVIIPMLLSARAGDEIRISMFGGTGYEIVRALQFAAARGANIRIVFDRQLGNGATSWIRDPVLNLASVNPYAKMLAAEGISPGSIQVQLSTWTGKNHYKVGTLSRMQADGTLIAEEIIIGSQNWSSGGNDQNDENLVSIQNFNQDVPAAKAFNQEFDSRLWVKSTPDRRNPIPSLR